MSYHLSGLKTYRQCHYLILSRSPLALPHIQERWVEKNVLSALWNYSWDQPHSCGEMIVKVIMGRFPHSSLLYVWVLSVGEAQNDYLLDLILLHHPLEQQSSLSAAYEQVCCKMSILEVSSSNTPVSKCCVCYRKVRHT